MRSRNTKTRVIFMAALSVGAAVQTAHASYDSTILADNPTGFWPLNETSGNVANNIAVGASAYGMTYNDVTTPQAVLGQAPAFAGAGASVLLQAGGAATPTPSASANASAGAFWTNGVSAQGNSASVVQPYDYSANFSIEAWINPTADASDYPATDREIFGGTTYGLTVDPNGALHFVANAKADFTNYTPTATVQNGVWQYVAVTFALTATNTVATYYINGVEVGQALHSTSDVAYTVAADPVVTDSNFAMGQYILTNEHTWLGGIDDLAIYNSVLSGTQILNHYDAATAAVPEPASISLLALAGLGLLSRRRKA